MGMISALSAATFPDSGRQRKKAAFAFFFVFLQLDRCRLN